MRILSIISLCFIGYFTTAQPFEILTFDGLIPKWTHQVFADDVELSQTVGFILQENDFYIVESISLKGFVDGFILEKINRHNGELLWQKNQIAYKNTSVKKEFVGHLNIDSLGVLNLLTIKDTTDGSYHLWNRGNYTERKFNSTNGSIIHEYSSDTSKVIISTSLSFFFQTTLRKYDHKIRYLETLGSGFYLPMKMLIIDKGSIISEKKIELRGLDPYSLRSRNLIDQGRDSIFVFAHSDTGSASIPDFRVELWHLDHKLNLVKKLDLASKLDPFNKHFVLDIKKDEFRIQSDEFKKQNGSSLTTKKIFRRFDFDGNLIEKITLDQTGTTLENRHYSKSLRLTNGKTIIAHTIRDYYGKDIQEINFFISDGMGHLDTLKSFKATSNKDQFRITGIKELDNNEILLILMHNKKGKVEKVQQLMCISYDELGITTSLDEIEAENSSFSVFPNPSFGKIEIVLHATESPTNIIIYDQLGKLVQNIPFSQTIDLKHLKGGYYLELRDDDKLIGITKIIIK